MTEAYKSIVKVTVNPRLKRLVANFLEHRRADVGRLRLALQYDDFESIQVLGHDMDGTGATFGFEQMTLIGRSMEQAAAQRQTDEVGELVEELAVYLSRVEVIYE